MRLENQLCSLGQAKKLKELGIKQDSLYYYFPNPNTEEKKRKYKLSDYYIAQGNEFLLNQIETIREMVLNGIFENTYSAFTISELLMMLENNDISWNLEYNNKKWTVTSAVDKKQKRNEIILKFDKNIKTQAEAFSSMLISFIESNHIKVKNINKRLLAF